MNKKIIAIDFDGTVVTHEFPNIGKDINAQHTLKRIVANGHRIILFTMRSDVEFPVSDDDAIHSSGGTYLTNAVNWFKENGIELWGINENPEQKSWTHSPKPYAHLYIDDAALGIPLLDRPDISDRPFVDWVRVARMLEYMKII
jgi:hypothetical protein